MKLLTRYCNNNSAVKHILDVMMGMINQSMHNSIRMANQSTLMLLYINGVVGITSGVLTAALLRKNMK